MSKQSSEEVKLSKPIFFLFSPDDFAIKNPAVISAIQSFESALNLIAIGNWTSVLLLIWNSCETLLQAKYPEKSLRAEELQKIFLHDARIPDSLHEQAVFLRKKRNDIAHNGYIPKDTHECIGLFFNAGIPYFNALLNNTIGRPLDDLFFGRKDNFWSILQNTRKVIIRKINKDDSNLENALLFLSLAAKEHFSPQYSRFSVRYSNNADDSLIWSAEMDLRKNLIDKMNNGSRDNTFEVKGIHCPTCLDTPLVTIEWDDEKMQSNVWKFKSFNSVGCYRCWYLIDDKDLIKIFFNNQITRKIKTWLESDDAPTAIK
jgi:hypothetical protein